MFADLGLPNAEEYQLKAVLVVQLKRLIAERSLTQIVAGKLLGKRGAAGRITFIPAA